MKDKIIATAGHDLKAGDIVYFSEKKINWFKKLILKLAFWHKPKPIAYKVTSVRNDSFTYDVDLESTEEV
jgi:hypothetical protein